VLFPSKLTDATETASEGREDVHTLARSRRRPKMARVDEFPSDVPDYVYYDDMPKIVCYGDIELFITRNPEGGRDIPVAIVHIRNFKGREQDAAG
jgi:hypothetical protein